MLGFRVVSLIPNWNFYHIPSPLEGGAWGGGSPLRLSLLKLPLRSPRGPPDPLAPTLHSASCTTRYRCLPTGVTGSSPRSTPAGIGQIREPSFYVGLRPCAVVVSAHVSVRGLEASAGLGDRIEDVEQVAGGSSEPIQPRQTWIAYRPLRTGERISDTRRGLELPTPQLPTRPIRGSG
jgi:hypothetical protein